MNRGHFSLYVTFGTHLQKKPDNAVIAFCSATKCVTVSPDPSSSKQRGWLTGLLSILHVHCFSIVKMLTRYMYKKVSPCFWKPHFKITKTYYTERTSRRNAEETPENREVKLITNY